MRFVRFTVAGVLLSCALAVLAGPAFLVIAVAAGADVYVRGGVPTLVLTLGLGTSLLTAARAVAFW